MDKNNQNNLEYKKHNVYKTFYYKIMSVTMATNI